MPHTTQRVAIITGGTRGIGQQIARRLTGEGFAVALAYAGNEEAAQATLRELTEQGANAIALRADVADEDDVAELFDVTEDTFGGVDVVVHAAGIMPLAPLVDLDLADLDAVLRTNVRGTFVVDQQAARRVRAGGAIINISSSVTRFSNPNNMAYIASKGAVQAMTLVLARELRGRNITVNAVAPGAVETEMLEKFVTEGGNRARDTIAAGSPMERIGTPDDIAEVVVFLAGPARWVNGQVIFANGGAI
jgi:3-oxoacyl-[acyl-carrier protein] reductase